MNEADLKSALVKLHRKTFPSFKVFRHEDKISSGVPDISSTGNDRTVWVEVKYAHPKIVSREIQDLSLLHLELAGLARYAIYYEKGDVKRTYFIKPSELKKPMSEWTNFTTGFDHAWLVEQIKEVHYHDYF